MSVETILEKLQNLVNIHEELVAISKQKTEVVKEGSVENLQALLVKERKQIRVLEKEEKSRQEAVETWLFKNELPSNDVTITRMLEIVSDQKEKQELEQATINLTQIITELKQQEQLNLSLINQSMQFVQLSIDTLQPSITNINYGNKQQDSGAMKRSVFDSQA
ncbi:flagellar biosynthesis/type III secretory pathway chaperone [Virgibacillus natechei]|uniref:Flagellar biosynthesis/type III secretory pathway chaperone n=1 Tax=Virgibacillus natechei TaxID=1216297 RepID=A0ABS4IJS1_9BACI|nr:flagellar protein FlgN [Virgibacillus natechei]MBP1971172.1 flagellar biosynthesis/type III secretory pathway chaperone [Virgibacillus natechei]UZD11919.1 flagellar protein FlgN [Virgibacillus natechei]